MTKRIYIASPYIKQARVNREIYDRLTLKGFEVFLPQSIDVDAVSVDEQKFVAQICYNEIDQCDIMVVVYPSGISVACEAGYFIRQKLLRKGKQLLLLNLDHTSDKIHTEVMIMPYLDREFKDVNQLINYFDELCDATRHPATEII